MIEDMSDAIALLSSGTYTVTRPGASALLNGRKIAATSSTFSIVASAQPTPGRVLQNLPEGFRDRGGYTLYTKTELRTSNGSGQEPDSVSIDGVAHQVAECKPYAALGNFYRAIVVRART